MMRRIVIAAAALFVALSAGCRSPQVTFYTLQPTAALKPTAVQQSALRQGSATPRTVPPRATRAVAVGPVTLPETVDRSQLVVRTDANRVAVLEYERWAEPLKSGIPRLIARDLRAQLGWDRIASYRQFSGAQADYRVLVDFVRFEAGPGQAVTVEALWTVRMAGGARKTGRSLIQEKAAGSGYDALVAAYSRAIAVLSTDLARAIRPDEVAPSR